MISQNELHIDLNEFNFGMKTFKLDSRLKKPKTSRAILAFDSGFLSIELDDKISVMNAVGSWNGKASFSSNFISALTLVPLTVNPVVVKYADGKLNIGGIKADADWEVVSDKMLGKLSNPSLIDIIAMYRTQPVLKLRENGIDKKNKLAQSKLLKLTESVAKKLSEFEVTQEDLLSLIETKVKNRIAKGCPPIVVAF
jgi:hypothetical protein